MPFSKSLPLLHLFNTERREKQPFTAQQDGSVHLYTCGPTVYDFAHIGNFRTYVFEDLLRRTLHFFGFKVKQVMNLTDIDDKTLKGAIHKKISLHAYTKPYIDAFFEDLATLGIQRAEHYPAATAFIPDMIWMIQRLLDKGYAYQGADGSVYFSLKKFPRYGRLSHLHLEELEAGASERVAQDEYDKESAADFVLWKSYDPERDGQIFWESPFGQGRPGWHIECSAMATKLLGETIDIHVGAVDNIFPHHENEIAQSEACFSKTFVRYWLHSEHLIVDHKKMSKSLGNFYTLRDLLGKGYLGVEVRYLLLQTHYRTQLNFTFDSLLGARSALQRLHAFVDRMHECAEGSNLENDQELSKRLLTACDQFAGHLADDLNISAALASLFDLVREVNALCDRGAFSAASARDVLALLQRWDEVLGVLFVKKEVAVPLEVDALLQERQQARVQKNWKLSDELRDKIAQLGFVIEDRPDGPRLKPKGGS